MHSSAFCPAEGRAKVEAGDREHHYLGIDFGDGERHNQFRVRGCKERCGNVSLFVVLSFMILTNYLLFAVMTLTRRGARSFPSFTALFLTARREH
jgi:hypothetical protein